LSAGPIRSARLFRVTRFQKAHFAFGVLFFLVFLATGLYMKNHFPEIYQSNEIIRFQFRANHIYVLLSALMNLLACLMKPESEGYWHGRASTVGAFFLLAAPLILVSAFFIEPVHAVNQRPLTLAGTIGLLVSVFLLVMSRFPWPKLSFRFGRS
jgi:hypothetical protein